MNKNAQNENKKRGRKRKNINNAVETPITFDYNFTNNFADNNIQLIIEESRNDIVDDLHNVENVNGENNQIPKKRGRKPKGGNLIPKQTEMNVLQSMVANVILHLKCSSNDLIEYNNQLNKLIIDPLVYNPDIPPNILTYSDKSSFFYYNNETTDNVNATTNGVMSSYIDNADTTINIDVPYHNAEPLPPPPLINPELINNNAINYNEPEMSTQIKYGYINYAYVETEKPKCNCLCNNAVFNNTEDKNDYEDRVNVKDINSKLKKLKINFYKNTLTDKKSACFWCTYDYDNQTCYIPKYEIDGKIHGYGSFCRPECAVAYLMKENIDDSTKFERYHLLNQVYSKIYNYNKNIKPSPNPYYLLDKFYGNLSIQEYRKLLKTEHMLLVIDKPLTRILPELHDDNEDIMLNLYGNVKTSSIQSTNHSGIYKVKRQSERQQGPSKSSIILEKFGGN